MATANNQCANCGQWVGRGHTCPIHTPPPVVTAPPATAPSAPPTRQIHLQPRVDTARAAIAAAQQDDQALIRRWSLVAGRDDPDTANAIARYVTRHSQPAPELHRGVALTPRNSYLTPQMLRPGTRLTLPASSFSEDWSVAEEFSYDQSGDDDQQTVMFTLRNGSAAPIHHLSEFPDQREWLTQGEFQIVSVTSLPDREIDFHVILEQIPPDTTDSTHDIRVRTRPKQPVIRTGPNYSRVAGGS